MRVVALSGGIDSTALALTELDATLVFTDTGDEFNELYAHLERIEAVTGRRVERIQSGETLLEYELRARFLPGHGARFCTRLFKIAPMNAWIKARMNGEGAELLVGLRADESEAARAGNLTQMDGLRIRYPLRERGMTRIDCVRVCLEHDLLPRYPAYMARGGCRGCFYKRRSEVVAMMQLVPGILAELRAREEAVQDERGKFFHMFPNVGMSIAELEMQQPLFDMATLYADALNKSDYGAACGLFCHR